MMNIYKDCKRYLIHALNNNEIIKLMVFDEYVSNTETFDAHVSNTEADACYTSSGFSLTDNLLIKALNELIQIVNKLREEVSSQVSQSIVILVQGLLSFCQ